MFKSVGLVHVANVRSPVFMKPQMLLFLPFCFLFAAVCSAESKRENQRPNVIFILADDLGIADIGPFGQEVIATPRLDQLAAEGVKFSQFYAGAPVCGPSRCSLITGKHTGNVTIRGNKWVPGTGVYPLREDDVTIAEALEGSGYVTGMSGRWHLGGEMSDQTPTDNGFDYHFGKLSSLHRNKGGVFIDPLWDEKGKHISREEYAAIFFEPMYENGKLYNLSKQEQKNRPINMDELVTSKAIEFIDANKSSPFFLYVAYSLVHSPMERHEQTALASDAEWPKEEQDFASMLRYLDELVGRIVDAVDERGLSEETLIIFTSDNGPHMEGGHDADFFDSNGDWKGYKRDLYEGGIRMPTIMRWTGTVDGGSVSDHQGAFWDVQATVCDLAGVPAPRSSDGLSFAPTLRGGEQPQHEYLYWEFPERSAKGWDSGHKQAVRKGDWKLLRFLADDRHLASQVPTA